MSKDLIPYEASPFTRLCRVFNFYSEKELIKKFKTTAQKLSLVEQTGVIPAEWLLIVLREEGVNPEWILTGKGAKRLAPSFDESHNENSHGTQKDIFFKTQFRPPAECSTNELIKEIIRRTVEDMYL